ncbi:MAG: histidine ammonia-lyase [Firmicutes bacterium]|nr:histidine ammonia-lyase [Bacillota bacterium]
MDLILLDGRSLTVGDVVSVARGGLRVEVSPAAAERVNVSRTVVERALTEGRAVYGVTTGFGKLSEVTIDPGQVQALQENLIVSHCAGVGQPLDAEYVRATMLLRANALAVGNSGVRLTTLNTLVDMLNAGVHPIVPEKGSLGASGDLAPLAHLCSVMIGRGEAVYQGRKMDGLSALRAAGIEPVRLEAKEGLALINGTQIMTAIGCLVAHDACVLLKTADVAAALTLEALRGIPDAFDELIVSARPHAGARESAANVRTLTKGSGLTTAPGEKRVQDAYALRCVPQVHGASRDAVRHVVSVLGTEINSATDNPLIFPATGETGDGGRPGGAVGGAAGGTIISGGNFHGQPVALAMDYLGIAVSEIANISERRIERMVNPALSGGLPPFLVVRSGLNSGFMLVQYTAAALVSENKILASPASVDSIPSSANQEDHVSMGTIAARKAREILWNAACVVAMELLTAAQAAEFCGPERLGAGTRAAYDLVRSRVPFLEVDRPLTPDIEAVRDMIRSGAVVEAVEKAAGPMA